MTSVARIIDFLSVKKDSKADFYKKTGLSNGYLDKVKVLGADKIESILKSYPDLNLTWLITGEGYMFIDPSDNLPVLNEPSTHLIKTPIKSRVKKKLQSNNLIKFFDIDFAAGDIEFFDDINTITPAYTMDIPEFNGCYAFRTYNNSMEKLIYSGDILFGTPEDDWFESLEYGQIYGIVCHNKRKYLKYIRKAVGKEDSHYLLKSENPEYDDFTLAKNKIKSIWLIHGWLKKRVG